MEANIEESKLINWNDHESFNKYICNPLRIYLIYTFVLYMALRVKTFVYINYTQNINR